MTTLPPNYTGVTRFTTSSGAATFATCPISFQNNAGWTIECWCSLDALVDSMPLVSKGTEFLLATQGSTLYAALGGQTVPVQTQTGALTIGIPYYFCVIYDGATMSLYLDGALVAQATTSANPSLTSTPLTVAGGFYGEVQGLRLWTQAMNANILGQNQFNDFPSGTTFLAAQVDFTVSPPADTSGNDLVPTLSAGSSYVVFVPAGTLGTSSFCDPYNDGTVNPAGSQTPFSVSAWICPALSDSLMYIFTNGVEESNSGMTFGINAGGNLFLQVGDSAVLTSNTVLADGAWVYVAATWTSPTATLYINGTQDSTSSTATLAGTLAVGEPCVGAIASVGAQLPIDSFEGQLQNVCVWNTALTATEVAGYQTASPQTDPACVAYYDLSQAPAQNQITFNPLGLVAGATLATAPVYGGGGVLMMADVARSGLAAALAASLRAPPSTSMADGEAFFEESARHFDAFMERLPISDLQRAYFRDLHATRLRDGHRDALAGKLADCARVRIERLPSGLARMTFVHEDGVEEVISEDAFDECTLWCINLVVAIVGALWLALGLAFNYSKFLSGMTNFFGTRINTIGIMPQLNALLESQVSAQSIYATLKLLFEYSLLTSIAKLSYQLVFSSLSWWTILSLGMRIVLLMSPGAVVEILWLITQLAYSVYSIVQVVDQRPQGCPSTSG